MESYYIYGYAVLLNARTLNTIAIENSNQKPYRQGFDITRKVMYVAFHSDSAVYVCMRYVDIVVDVAVIRRHCFCRLAFFSLLFLTRPLSVALHFVVHLKECLPHYRLYCKIGALFLSFQFIFCCCCFKFSHIYKLHVLCNVRVKVW